MTTLMTHKGERGLGRPGTHLILQGRPTSTLYKTVENPDFCVKSSNLVNEYFKIN
jgi:hypothetical protein